jgi:quercetin dioxygenase-like cupin family protein
MNKMKMNEIDIKKIIEYPKKGITSKEIAKSGDFSVDLFCMAAKTSISEHTSTKKGYVYVLEGKGIFNLKNKKIQMKPGVLINLDKNAKHSLNADKKTAFLLFLA